MSETAKISTKYISAEKKPGLEVTFQATEGGTLVLLMEPGKESKYFLCSDKRTLEALKATLHDTHVVSFDRGRFIQHLEEGIARRTVQRLPNVGLIPSLGQVSLPVHQSLTLDSRHIFHSVLALQDRTLKILGAEHLKTNFKQMQLMIGFRDISRLPVAPAIDEVVLTLRAIESYTKPNSVQRVVHLGSLSLAVLLKQLAVGPNPSHQVLMEDLLADFYKLKADFRDTMARLPDVPVSLSGEKRVLSPALFLAHANAEMRELYLGAFRSGVNEKEAIQDISRALKLPADVPQPAEHIDAAVYAITCHPEAEVRMLVLRALPTLFPQQLAKFDTLHSSILSERLWNEGMQVYAAFNMLRYDEPRAVEMLKDIGRRETGRTEPDFWNQIVLKCQKMLRDPAAAKELLKYPKLLTTISEQGAKDTSNPPNGTVAVPAITLIFDCLKIAEDKNLRETLIKNGLQICRSLIGRSENLPPDQARNRISHAKPIAQFLAEHGEKQDIFGLDYLVAISHFSDEKGMIISRTQMRKRVFGLFSGIRASLYRFTNSTDPRENPGPKE